MPEFAIAAFPSQQNNNPGGVGPNAFANEMLQMRWFASVLAEAAKEYPAVELRVFEGLPYSASTYDLQTLYENERAGKAWLDAQFAARVHQTLALNLHTDAGTVNQIGRYWDADSPDSKAMADALIGAVHPLFPGAAIWGKDYGEQSYGKDCYVFAKVMQNRHRAVLLELGSHLREDHTTILRTKALEIAHAILGAACAHVGVYGRKAPAASRRFPAGLVGPGLDAYLLAHPEYGDPRTDDPALKGFDKLGNEFVWTTATAEHKWGSYLMWRDWLAKRGENPIDVLTWD